MLLENNTIVKKRNMVIKKNIIIAKATVTVSVTGSKGRTVPKREANGSN